MQQDDEAAIRAVIENQFQCLSWDPERAPDWQGFEKDFVPDAPLYPGARPIQASTVKSFVARMRALSESSLKMLYERLVGDRILVFGNVAVALAVCELDENGGDRSRNVEAMLLVKNDGAWKIAAQAWDTETDAKTIPGELLNRG